MKGPLDRTKVVLRHLPHTISQSALMEQIDARFSGRYNWFSFRSGKQSLKCQSYSRAYIDFKRPEDVIEFAEFYDGHVFVNEKGTQFKTIVEYAPSQRVPKQWSKKDGREGTIMKDPEYLEFLESVSKPVENLPSAEIQLERKEAERAAVGAAKEAPIVTPLMDFVRQKRAAKGGPRRSLPNGKLMRRNGASSSSSNSTVVKRGSEKRNSTMYVQREGGKSTNGKEKSTYVKRAERQASEKSPSSSTQSGSVVLDEEKGSFGASDTGKKKILLLKGKEKEIPNVTTGMTPQQKLLYGSGGGRQNQRQEASGRIIRSILLKDSRQNQSEQNQDKDRRPPRPQNVGPLSNGLQDDKPQDGFYGRMRVMSLCHLPLLNPHNCYRIAQKAPPINTVVIAGHLHIMLIRSRMSFQIQTRENLQKEEFLLAMRSECGFKSQVLALRCVTKVMDLKPACTRESILSINQ
ncbi:unnamed protein product [Lactuca saligna]|uniref:UPF3 domain-containing protein n=1 Tax=Lactuca saligna TaxID=75948 RepID=A0AA36A4L2_LACSI|nr:unnamed protein product [Lactuca saligna]